MNRRDLTRLKEGDYVECVQVFKASKNNLTKGSTYKVEDVFLDEFQTLRFEIIADRGELRNYSARSSQFRIHKLQEVQEVIGTGQRVEFVLESVGCDLERFFTTMPIPLPVNGDFVQVADFIELEDLTANDYSKHYDLTWSVYSRTWCKNEYGVYLRLFLTAE